MKERILYWSIMVAGIVSLFLYISTRFLPLMNTVLVEKMDMDLHEFTKYGDLYYNNCISHFKQDFPEQIRRYRLSGKNPKLNEAQILTFGDSFFDVSFQKTLPERLADTTLLTVYSYITQDPTQSNPFCILNSSGLNKPSEPQIIIFETVERNIDKKFGDPYTTECSEPYLKYNNFRSKLLHEYIFKSTDEQLFDLILKRSVLTHNIYSFFSTIKFDLFRNISSMTPKFTVEPDPWLFHSNTIDNGPGSFYYKHTSNEITTYAANIAHLSKELKRVYNLEMIFMIVPNKYTLYHYVINNDTYNDFIPALQKELDKLDVQYVDLYHTFLESGETLYYGTDTHWNKKGVDMALEMTLFEIEQSFTHGDNTQNINNLK